MNYRNTPNSPLEIKDSTTPKQIKIGIIGSGGLFFFKIPQNNN
jgi:hypothetical protein